MSRKGHKKSANRPTPGIKAVATPGPAQIWSWLFAAALVVAVFIVYQPAWHGGFIFDDDLCVAQNPALKPGGLANIWVPGYTERYWPLTYAAFGLQYEMWGLNTLGYHLTNIALHALAARLAWRALVQLRVPGAMLAAAIFALHPVNVESVAWITQLKNILSLTLALVATLFYLRHERGGGWWSLAAALGTFLLSALAKGMVLTLPIVWLACAWWQRGKIDRQDLLRVLPFVLIGLLMAGVEVWAGGLDGSDTARTDGLASRTAIAGSAVWFYLWKLVWPLNLCFIYPCWKTDDLSLLAFLPGILLVILLGVAWWQRRSWGGPVVMLLVGYLALLLPALGFVNIGFMQYSLVGDHYQYAAMLVPCAVFAGAAATLAARLRCSSLMAYGFSLTLLAALSALTWQQSGVYANEETLYTATLEKNPTCWLAHNNLGKSLGEQKRFEEAVAHYQRALQIKPDYEEAELGLGNTLSSMGRTDEAIAHLRQALNIKPDYVEVLNNLGNVLAAREQVDEAIACYRNALAINPEYAPAYTNLGAALAGRGQFDEAIVQYRKAIGLDPNNAEAHNNLGVALARSGQINEAIVEFQKALSINPNFSDARQNLDQVQSQKQ